jgi:hypothetical protein
LGEVDLVQAGNERSDALAKLMEHLLRFRRLDTRLIEAGEEIAVAGHGIIFDALPIASNAVAMRSRACDRATYPTWDRMLDLQILHGGVRRLSIAH